MKLVLLYSRIPVSKLNYKKLNYKHKNLLSMIQDIIIRYIKGNLSKLYSENSKLVTMA